MVDPKKIHEIVKKYEQRQMALLPVLHYIQEAEGHISASHHFLLTDVFNITQAELRGVISFYHDFRSEPSAAKTVRICRAEACQANGSEDLAANISGLLAKAGHQDIQVEEVYCLGLCASGPSADINGKPYARLTTEKLSSLLGLENAS